MAVKQGFRYHWNRFVRLRPVCQRMPAISLSDGVPLTGKIGQKRARRPGEYAFSGKSRWAINRLSGMRVDRPRGEREDHCGH